MFQGTATLNAEMQRGQPNSKAGILSNLTNGPVVGSGYLRPKRRVSWRELSSTNRETGLSILKKQTTQDRTIHLSKTTNFERRAWALKWYIRNQENWTSVCVCPRTASSFGLKPSMADMKMMCYEMIWKSIGAGTHISTDLTPIINSRVTHRWEVCIRSKS